MADGNSPDVVGARIVVVALNQITPDPNQPRKRFSEEALQTLAESVRASGVVQPIIIRSTPRGEDGTAHICPYMIIAGERRWRASGIAEKADIIAILRDDLSEHDVRVLQLTENLEREDLTFAETCDHVARLVELIGFDGTVAKTKRSDAWVSKHSRITSLPEPVQQLVNSELVTSADIAHDLGRIYALDKNRAASLLYHFRSSAEGHGQPPTRAQIRNALSQVENSRERREEQKVEKKKEREAAKTDPKLQKKLEAERKKEADKKGIKERRAAAKKYCQTLADQLTESICRKIGITPKKRGTYGYAHDTPFYVAPPYFNDYDTNEPPKTAEAAKYSIHSYGSFEVVKPAAVFFDAGEVKFTCNEKVTLAQAAALHAILGKKAIFNLSGEAKGSALQELATAVAAKPKKPAGDEGSIADFLNENVDRSDPEARLNGGPLLERYNKWCIQRKLKPLSGNNLAVALEAEGITRKRFNDGRAYMGCKLLPVRK